MGPLPKSTKRRDLIRRFRKLGWTGPWKGVGPHPEYMEKEGRVVKIPNPHSHQSGIGEPLLKIILRSAGISAEEWVDGKKGYSDGEGDGPEGNEAVSTNGDGEDADDSSNEPPPHGGCR